ncbi:hypothetical protein CVT24_008303, partial [Panaeolus cyanescens]
KEITEFAIANGVLRGSYGGKKDEVVGDGREVEPNPSAADEGLRALVQTTKCRRRVTTKAYRNITSDAPSVCCDICNPVLLNRTRPGPPIPKTRQVAVKKAAVCDPLKWAIYKWRTDTHQRDFPDAMHGPSALLPDSLILSLSSMGPVTEEGLKRALDNQWIFYSRYRDELLTVIQNIPAAAYLTVDSTQTTQKKTNKRKAQEISTGFGVKVVDKHVEVVDAGGCQKKTNKRKAQEISTGSGVKIVDKQIGKHVEVVDAGGCQPSISPSSMPITPAMPRATPIFTYPSTPMSRTGSFFSTPTTTPYGGYAWPYSYPMTYSTSSSTPTQTSSSPAVIYPGQYYQSGYFGATYPVYSMGRQTSDNSQPSLSSSSSTNPVLSGSNLYNINKK